MLRRPITTLSITAEDVADFEDRRAERLEAQRAMRHRGIPQSVLRDPRLQRITQGAHQTHPARGHAAGWEYDSAEEDEGGDDDEEEEEEEEEEREDDDDDEQLPYSTLNHRDQAMLLQAGLVPRAARSEGNDGQMDIDQAPGRGRSEALARAGLRATPVAAAAAPVTPGAPGASGALEHSTNPHGRAAASPSDPPEGAIRTRIRMAGRVRPTREERIGVAPPAPDRRRRQQGPGQQHGGSQP